jgi:DNA-binding XRE family transcriptional regulator
MNIVIIPEDITDEEMTAKAKALELPKPPPKLRGWAAYWEKRKPEGDFEPPPLITREEMKCFRQSKGWTQENLGVFTGYAESTIKNMELGTTRLSPMLSSMIRLLMEIDRLKAENEELKASQEAP